MHPSDVDPYEVDEGDSAPMPLSGAIASALSFLLPGLGQAWAGARTRGFLMALPVLVLVGAAIGTWFTNKGLILDVLFNPTLLAIVVAAIVVFGIYRLWVIADAYRLGRGRRTERTSGAERAVSVVVLVGLLMATFGMHAYAAYVGWSARETLVAVFDPTGPGSGETPPPTPDTSTPRPSDAPPTPEPTPTPVPTPTPPPAWAADGRLNVLLIGSDAGPGRWSQRADAIILVSVDIASGRIAAFSLPRYTYNVPLPEPAASNFGCGCLVEPINALFVFALQNPALFPGEGELKGWTAVSGAIEALFDVTLDGMAVVDLNGFVALVDAVGGVTVDVPAEVYDAEYPDPDGVTVHEIYFPAGVQDMDGWHALAYARTRHQDGDVSRMGRQQTVIRALGQELSCNLLFNLPSVLQVARDTLWTNLPLEDVPEMMRIDPAGVESHVLFDIHNPTLNDAEIARLRAEVADAFAGPPPPDESPVLEC